MGKLVYNIIIKGYRILIGIISPINPKAKLWISGRKDLFNKVSKQLDANTQTIWIHCASLGEFEQGRPIIEYLKDAYPQYKILLTFFSPSGYEVRKDYDKADIVCYLPLDTAKNAEKFIKLTNPKMAFFIKYEYWYHFFKELKKQNVPTYMVSAIFRPDQIFFKSWAKWYRKILKNVTHFFVQNQSSKTLLHTLGYNNITVSGDTRFDRVKKIIEKVEPIPILDQFCAGQKVIIAGSTWKTDEDLLIAFIRKNPNEKFVIAPHEISKNIKQNIQKIFGKDAIAYSDATEKGINNERILIIDCFGILTSVYQYAKIAYIGGGFGAGIHNILEPAAYGIPVVFGPKFQKFREAVELINLGGAFCITSSKELEKTFTDLSKNQNRFNKAAGASSEYIKDNTGATSKIFAKVFNN